jgi:DNA-binding transcriptional regulator YiaG
VIADALGVSARTVHKWVTGVNRPSPEAQGMLSAWVKARRAEIKRRKETI